MAKVGRQPGRFGHVLKPLACVAKQIVLADVEDEEVGTAVVVVIGKDSPTADCTGQAHVVRPRMQAKAAVAVVLVQPIGSRMVGGVQVEPAVGVYIAPRLANEPLFAPPLVN